MAVTTESATTVGQHTGNDRAAQHEDQVDFPCSEAFLRHYYRTGLSPHSMGLRRRRSTPVRSGRPIPRPGTSESLSEELARLRHDNTELRAQNHALGKQVDRLNIELRIVQQRLDASQTGHTQFRGIPDIYASSTD